MHEGDDDDARSASRSPSGPHAAEQHPRLSLRPRRSADGHGRHPRLRVEGDLRRLSASPRRSDAGSGSSRSIPCLDYSRHVDGRPRLDGVRAFLASRHIELSRDAGRGLGERKNELVLELLRREGVEPYRGLRPLRARRSSGRTATGGCLLERELRRRPRGGRNQRPLRAAHRRHLHADEPASRKAGPRCISRRRRGASRAARRGGRLRGRSRRRRCGARGWLRVRHRR